MCRIHYVEHTSCVVEEPLAFSSFVIVAMSSGGGGAVSPDFSPSIMTSSGTTVSFVCSLGVVEQCLRATTMDPSAVAHEGNLGASCKFLLLDGVDAVSALLIVVARCDTGLRRGLAAKAVTALGANLTAFEATEAARTRGMRYIARWYMRLKRSKSYRVFLNNNNKRTSTRTNQLLPPAILLRGCGKQFNLLRKKMSGAKHMQKTCHLLLFQVFRKSEFTNFAICSRAKSVVPTTLGLSRHPHRRHHNDHQRLRAHRLG